MKKQKMTILGLIIITSVFSSTGFAKQRGINEAIWSTQTSLTNDNYYNGDAHECDGPVYDRQYGQWQDDIPPVQK